MEGKIKRKNDVVIKKRDFLDKAFDHSQLYHDLWKENKDVFLEVIAYDEDFIMTPYVAGTPLHELETLDDTQCDKLIKKIISAARVLKNRNMYMSDLGANDFVWTGRDFVLLNDFNPMNGPFLETSLQQIIRYVQLGGRRDFGERLLQAFRELS